MPLPIAFKVLPSPIDTLIGGSIAEYSCSQFQLGVKFREAPLSTRKFELLCGWIVRTVSATATQNNNPASEN